MSKNIQKSNLFRKHNVLHENMVPMWILLLKLTLWKNLAKNPTKCQNTGEYFPPLLFRRFWPPKAAVKKGGGPTPLQARPLYILKAKYKGIFGQRQKILN